MDDILVLEVDVLNALNWDIISLICPLDIIVNLSFQLQLAIVNNINKLKHFCGTITNYLIWSSWNVFSNFSLAIGTLLVFCEIMHQNNDAKNCLFYVIGLNEKLQKNLTDDILLVRQYVFKHLENFFTDEKLIISAKRLSKIRVIENYIN